MNEMTMRICFVISGFGQGGAQKQCVALLNELSQLSELEIELIHFEEGVNFDDLVLDRLKVTRLASRSHYDPINIFRLAKALRKSRPDIVFSWLHTSDVLSALARRALPSIKWIMAERDSFYPDNWRYNLRRFLGRRADHIVCNSQNGKQYWLQNGAKPEQVSVISNINLVDPSEHTSKRVPREKSVIYAGRLEPQKDVLRLARAFAEGSKLSDMQFQIIGDGTLEADIRRIVEKSGRPNFKISNYDPNIFERYARAPVYVTLSQHEGTPNAVIENIAFGNVIVASRIPEHVDLLGPDYPFYVDPDDTPEEIARILCAASEARENGALAYARNRISQLTPKAIMNDYLSLFQKVSAK